MVWSYIFQASPSGYDGIFAFGQGDAQGVSSFFKSFKNLMLLISLIR